jgi:hypothetical protein
VGIPILLVLVIRNLTREDSSSLIWDFSTDLVTFTVNCRSADWKKINARYIAAGILAKIRMLPRSTPTTRLRAAKAPRTATFEDIFRGSGIATLQS